MAEQRGGEKTEKASPQKLRKAREKGQVARSRDAATAIGLCAALGLLIAMAPACLNDFRALFELAFAPLQGEHAADARSALLPGTLWLLLKILLPLGVIPLCIIASAGMPGGWVLNLTSLAPKLERLSPRANLGKLFKAQHAAQVLTAIVKVIALIAVLYVVLRTYRDDFIALQSDTPLAAVVDGAALVRNSALALCSVFVVFALIDIPLQKWLFLRNQRMSRQEVKDEHKQSEGRPEVKQRIRQIQRRMAQSNIRRTVPDADVVVVNPTHYAVALKYDAARADAPFVVAKGVDEMAAYIREIARDHHIDIVTLPPLARAIYHTSQVNQQIPAALYHAVALVLTYTLQLQAFRNGQRITEPALPTALAIPAELSEPRSP